MSGQGQPVTPPAAPQAQGTPVSTPTIEPAGAVGAAPPAASPAAPAPAESGSPPPPVAPTEPGAAAPQAVPSDWRDKRIAQLTAKLAEERARNASPPAPAASPPGLSPVLPPAPSAPAGPQVGTAEFDQAVQREATIRSQVAAFNAECNTIAAAGRTAYGETEFNQRAAALLNLIDRNDPQALGNYNSFLMAASKTGEGAKLIFELGSDLNEAMRVMQQSPIEMAVELTRRAMRPGSAPAPSNAPKPITPIGNRGGQHTPIDPSDPARAKQLSTADWMSRREEQAAERRKQKYGH